MYQPIKSKVHNIDNHVLGLALHDSCTIRTTLITSLQDCLVYLCGTKYDLVQEDKKARKVEASTVERYGDGNAAILM